ncbi:MAG: branched-chain amino acid ABC transporter permease [Dermatophilaceae bacterium]
MTDQRPPTRRASALTGDSTELVWSSPRARVPRSARHGRPRVHTRYAADQALLDTPAKRRWALGGLAVATAAPFLLTQDLTYLLSVAMVYAVAGIGLNLLTGYTGQISLGHPFFMALGAYTAAVVSGRPSSTVWGLGLDLSLGLVAATVLPALVGLVVAPLATRVRGLYLAVLTLGLLMLGEQVFKEWRALTGGAGVGRAVAQPVLFGTDLSRRYAVGPLIVDKDISLYLLVLAVLVLLGVGAGNLARSRTGRALAAVRDRDIAAEVMGIPLLRTKTLAFMLSSGYAGTGGALLSILVGRITPEQWNIFFSISLLAVVVIGGAARITGTVLGAAFVVLLPRLLEWAAPYLPFVATGSGGLLTVFQLQTLVFGVLIVVFLTVEPRGLFGLWHRVRAYASTWPFSY